MLWLIYVHKKNNNVDYKDALVSRQSFRCDEINSFCVHLNGLSVNETHFSLLLWCIISSFKLQAEEARLTLRLGSCFFPSRPVFPHFCRSLAICCVSAAVLIRINAPRTPWCCRYRPALHLFGARTEIRRLSVSLWPSSSIKRGWKALLLLVNALLSEPARRVTNHIRQKRPRGPSELVSRQTEKFNQCFGY